MSYAFRAPELFHRKGGGGGVSVEGIGDILKLAKCNNVSACSRKFL